MHLAGQAKRMEQRSRTRGGEQGYAMAALLIGLSIMAIMMTVVMPVWKQQVRREKEEELVFRGKQYVHAIGLYQKKVANTFPPNIDLLVEQRFLRKKFKDPITNDDFVPIPVGGAIPGQTAPTGQRGATGSTGPGSTGGAAASGAAGAGGAQGGGRGGGPPASSVTSPGQSASGIMGVTSKSKEQSIRLYNGRGHYNEWAFLFVQTQQAPGAGTGNTANPGQQPGRGQQPPAGVNPGGSGRGPNGPGGRGPFGGPNGPGGRGGGPGGTSPFGGGGVTPIQPPTPRGRL